MWVIKTRVIYQTSQTWALEEGVELAISLLWYNQSTDKSTITLTIITLTEEEIDQENGQLVQDRNTESVKMRLRFL